jgi:hypothetical protein
MKIIELVSLEALQQHEVKTGSNSVLGGYGMDKHCPLTEFELSRVKLESRDVDRMFLLSDFLPHTDNRSGRLTDVRAVARSIEGVASLISAQLDLRLSQHMELVLVSTAAAGAPLTVIDGNHRAIAHYLTHGNMEGVGAFLCVHARVNLWRHLPLLAR